MDNRNKEYEAIAKSIYLDYEKWKSKKRSPKIFSVLRKVEKELKKRPIRYDEDNPSDYLRVIKQDSDIINKYRHLRDFGSLINFNTDQDKKIAKKIENIYSSFNDNIFLKIQLECNNKDIFSQLFEEEKKSKTLYEILNKKILPKTIKTIFRDSSVSDEFISFLKKRLKNGIDNMPEESLRKGGVGKLIRVFIGIIMYSYYSSDFNHSNKKELLSLLKSAYYFSMSYPFLDDVLDSSELLSEDDKKQYVESITRSFNRNNNNHLILIPNIYFIREFYFSCYKLNKTLPIEDNIGIYSYIYSSLKYHSIEKSVEYHNHSTENMFINIMLKAGFTRLAAASLGKYGISSKFISDLLLMSLNNQLSNDFVDLVDDINNSNNTPFTLFIKNKTLDNPFEHLLLFIEYTAYRHDNEEIMYILSYRVVETIREYIIKNGIKKYKNYINTLTKKESLNEYCNLFYRIGDLSDRLVYTHEEYYLLDYINNQASLYYSKNNSESLIFLRTMQCKYGYYIENIITSNEKLSAEALYSLSSISSRIRPMLCCIVADAYNIDIEKIRGVIMAIEYFHTASLILDDLPSQDNASIRRYKKTLHKKFNEADAQLTAIELISLGYEELSKLNFEHINKLIEYASSLSREMVIGQKNDLKSTKKNTVLKINDLITNAIQKTSLAFEFSLVCIPLLINESSSTIDRMKNYSQNIGIAYQIYDDLKDLKDSNNTGKDMEIDITNKKKTFSNSLTESQCNELIRKYVSDAILEVKELKCSSQLINIARVLL